MSWYTPIAQGGGMGDYSPSNPFIGQFSSGGQNWFLQDANPLQNSGLNTGSPVYKAFMPGNAGLTEGFFTLGPDGKPQMMHSDYNPNESWGDDFRAMAPVLGAAALGFGAEQLGLLGGATPNSSFAWTGGASPVAQSFPISMPGAATSSALPAASGATGAATVPGAVGTGAGAGTAGYGYTFPEIAAAGSGSIPSGGNMLSQAGSWLGNNSNWLMPLIGAAAGAAGSGDTQQTSEQRMPPWLEQLSQNQAGVANNLLGMQYPGQEPFNADQQNAFSAVRNAANSPLSGQADSLASATLRGDYLNNNPYMDSIVNQTMNDLQGRFNTTALGSGSFGNANVTEQGMRGMSDAANTLRFNNYNAERGRQMQTLGLMPTLDQSRYAGANNLLNIGNMQQQFGQQERYGPINWYTQLLQSSGIPLTQYRGGSTTQTQQGNPWSGGLGGGLLGLQLARLFNQG